jgi:hypothetical protein
LEKDKIITIHQPDMMPWLGFFSKISNADIWVVLDHTENNTREAAFWGRRVQMLINKQSYWVSVPLKKDEGSIGTVINKMLISNVKSKMLKTCIQSYSRAPFFGEFKYLLEEFFNSKEESLMVRNMKFINEVIRLLGISTQIVLSSELNCKSKSTDLLVEIIKKLNGTMYLAGGGAGEYQDDNLFIENNIVLKYNSFSHPVYPQFNNKEEFIMGLSVLDCLMNIGVSETKKILNIG